MLHSSINNKQDGNPLLAWVYVDKESFLEELKKFVIKPEDELVRHAVVISVDISSGSRSNF